MSLHYPARVGLAVLFSSVGIAATTAADEPSAVPPPPSLAGTVPLYLESPGVPQEVELRVPGWPYSRCLTPCQAEVPSVRIELHARAPGMLERSGPVLVTPYGSRLLLGPGLPERRHRLMRGIASGSFVVMGGAFVTVLGFAAYDWLYNRDHAAVEGAMGATFLTALATGLTLYVTADIKNRLLERFVPLPPAPASFGEPRPAPGAFAPLP